MSLSKVFPPPLLLSDGDIVLNSEYKNFSTPDSDSVFSFESKNFIAEEEEDFDRRTYRVHSRLYSIEENFEFLCEIYYIYRLLLYTTTNLSNIVRR